jgi:hypothetical protein
LVAAISRTLTRSDRSAPSPLQLSGFQGAQQLGLRFEAEIADLVEEQRPAAGQLKPPDPPVRGAGKGAPLVAEHFGLHQVARNRGAVHGDKGLPGSPAHPVNRGGDQLLAGAGFSGHQDPGLGGRHLGDLFPHPSITPLRPTSSPCGVIAARRARFSTWVRRSSSADRSVTSTASGPRVFSRN